MKYLPIPKSEYADGTRPVWADRQAKFYTGGGMLKTVHLGYEAPWSKGEQVYVAEDNAAYNALKRKMQPYNPAYQGTTNPPPGYKPGCRVLYSSGRSILSKQWSPLLALKIVGYEIKAEKQSKKENGG
jgi:hypothetical protein